MRAEKTDPPVRCHFCSWHNQMLWQVRWLIACHVWLPATVCWNNLVQRTAAALKIRVENNCSSSCLESAVKAQPSGCPSHGHKWRKFSWTMKTGKRGIVDAARCLWPPHNPHPITISISVHCSIAVQRGPFNNLNLALKFCWKNPFSVFSGVWAAL